MTNQTNWTEYTGSDEQIAELLNAKDGYVIRLPSGREYISKDLTVLNKGECYWIIPADPLREMKVRQAMTKQPVWVKEKKHSGAIWKWCTTTPDWNIPNAEYSFTEFKD